MFGSIGGCRRRLPLGVLPPVVKVTVCGWTETGLRAPKNKPSAPTAMGAYSGIGRAGFRIQAGGFTFAQDRQDRLTLHSGDKRSRRSGDRGRSGVYMVATPLINMLLIFVLKVVCASRDTFPGATTKWLFLSIEVTSYVVGVEVIANRRASFAVGANCVSQLVQREKSVVVSVRICRMSWTIASRVRLLCRFNQTVTEIGFDCLSELRFVA